MKLAYVNLCGFRGYSNPVRIDFADGVTVLDGRNGVGKSTVFDAVEFALTGTIAKYGEAKADGETVADYIWWTGEGAGPVEKYVEVGFSDENGDLATLRRSQLAGVGADELAALLVRLCDTALMPKAPLSQLCAASIIRDEQIAALSVDLKETERYALLREAIGATDAEEWVERGAKVLAIAKRHVESAEAQAKEAAMNVTVASRRIDELRASLVDEAVIASASERLRATTGSSATPDMLVEPARALVVELSSRVELLQSLEARWSEYEDGGKGIFSLREALEAAQAKLAEAESALAEAHAETLIDLSAAAMSKQARELAALLVSGRRVGRLDGKCPVCSHEQDEASFLAGLAQAESLVARMDARAVEQERQEEKRRAAEESARTVRMAVEAASKALAEAESRASALRAQFNAAGFAEGASLAELRAELERALARLAAVRDDLQVVETLKLSATLERAVHDESEAKDAYARAERRLGSARLAASRAQALHDAARRATGETLNRRLERVLPLMAELYRRLRPHPLWSEIDYKVRGDVRRFMKLEVGDELNPQFMFSSGQRRATGLAFLLSVNLALAWSRWRTLLLDDPVQHVDDFRSIHLAEVLAQVRASGRQVICAVEDEALADLLCRRLPVGRIGEGKRITLGLDAEGALAKVREEALAPMLQGTLVTDTHRLAG
jgi:chromosome segregation protein